MPLLVVFGINGNLNLTLRGEQNDVMLSQFASFGWVFNNYFLKLNFSNGISTMPK